MDSVMAILLTIFAVVVFGVVFISVAKKNKQLEQLQRYWDVEIGMTEEEMLDIMGEDFNRSLLKNNRVKYEWRINATSRGTSYKGISYREYSGVKKVTIYLRNGIVVEVRPYNV